MRQLRRRFQYRVNRVFSRGSWVPFASLAVVASSVVLLGSNARFLGLFSPESLEASGIENKMGGGFRDGFFWALKHVMDPGAFADNYGSPFLIATVALLLSVLGLLILGVLIGFITNLVQRRVQALERGNTPVVEEGHTLLLGWNKQIFSVLRELARLRARHVVVILAAREIAAMREDLRSGGLLELPLDIVLRSGRSDNEAELERVAAEHANSIIVLARDRQAGSATDPDVEVIKTLMLLSQQDRRLGRTTRVVGEIREDRNYEIAAIACQRHFPVVSSAQYISRLLVQSARYPGLARVYDELLRGTDDTPGGPFRVEKVEPAVDGTFGQASIRLSGAVPIGVTWPVEEAGHTRAAAALNPEPDYEIDADEQLVLLSRGQSYAWNGDLHSAASARSVDKVERPIPRRVLILGRSHMIDEILQELNRHVTGTAEVCVAVETGVEEVAGQIDRSALGQLELWFEPMHPDERAALRGLDPSSFETIFVLADTSPETADPDARTILTLLLLEDLRKSHRGGTWPRVVAEIYDPRNRELLKETRADDLIVSPEITSALITQISQLPVLAPVYRELLSAGGIEIGLRPVSAYARTGDAVPFLDLVAASQARFEVALGVLLGSDELTVVLNPSKEQRFRFGSTDRVIVLAQQLYA